MYFVEKLHRPSGLAEALDILAKGDRIIPMAGGTDILVELRKSRAKGVRLMSLSGLPELRGISEDAEGNIVIGAGSTFAEIGEDARIAAKVPMLRTAALSLGGPQTRNVATIGGNICNGATSADAAPSLFALDAVLELANAGEVRSVPITSFYAGPGKVNKAPDELLTRIILPIGQKQIWAGYYIKMSTRKAMDISMLGSAAVCELAADGSIKTASIALGTAAPTPIRCPEAEAILNGKRLTESLLKEAGRKAAASSNPRSSWRASEAYRRELVEELSARAFRRAFEAAGGKMK
jgi:xanthine dehydrogenase FAD-binding subunit